MRALAAALLLVSACEKPAPLPLKIRYAAKTEAAANGTNNTYFSIVEDDALFIVADANDPYTGKEAAYRFSAAFAKPCREADDRLRCALSVTHGELEHASFSLAAVAIAGNHAFEASVGRMPVLFRHGQTLAPGDSLVLVNQPLLDVLGEARVRAAMPEQPSTKDVLEASVARLIDDAKAAGPHDPATAILVQLVTN